MSLLGGGTGALTGDIWSTGAFSFESPLKDLLDSKDYTLEQLMAEDELLQELRGLHPILTEYFSTEKALTELIRYIILPPAEGYDEDTTRTFTRQTEKEQKHAATNGVKNTTTASIAEDCSTTATTTSTAAQRLHRQLEKRKLGDYKKNPESDPEFRRIRFPYMACEIISCEIDGIINTLVDGHVCEDHDDDDERDSPDGNVVNGEQEVVASATAETGSLFPPPTTAAAAGEQDPTAGGEVLDSSVSSLTSVPLDGTASALTDGTGTPTNSTSSRRRRRMRLLDLFFSVLYETPAGQLDDYRAGYFEKILSLLFRKRAVDLSEFINTGGAHGKEALMQAMLKHLYCNSILQICQRLLLPPRPTPQRPPAAADAHGEAGQVEPNGEPVGGDDDEEGGGQDILAGEEDDDEEGEEGEHGGGGLGGFKCEWSQSGLAIDLLLDRLMNPEPLLPTVSASQASLEEEPQQEHATPKSPQLPQIIRPLSAVETDQSIAEQRLNLSFNASEVLVTVIQNSLLSSDTMLHLSSLDILQRLTQASITVRTNDYASSSDADDLMALFPPHESLVTSAMNVVESLILQLGGYGAVGTMAIMEPSAVTNPATGASSSLETTVSMTTSEGEEQTHFSAKTANPNAAVDDEKEKNNADDDDTNITNDNGNNDASRTSNPPLIADMTNLLQVLPKMLQGFAILLRHPATQLWKSPVQFSPTEPVPLLGTPRLRIVRVLESLVLLGDSQVDRALVESDCLVICLDLFWEFQWCSMLHQSVANLLVHVFEGQNARLEIQEYFISHCNLLGRLLNSFVTGPPHSTHPSIEEQGNEDKGHDDNDDNDEQGIEMDELNKTSNTEEHTAAQNSNYDEPKDSSEVAATTAEVLTVSEDDIDAAMEKQEDEEKACKENEEGRTVAEDTVDVISTEAVNLEEESPDTTTEMGTTSPPAQSFRFGYMGHVIIVSQALVQACAGPDWAAEQQGVDENGNPQMEQLQEHQMNGAEPISVGALGEPRQSQAATDPIMIADLVNNHELAERWQDFVITTLASEIAVQSTPLGGMNAQPVMIADHLQTPQLLAGRRPGLADDGDIGDGDGAMAPLPPRGMLTASDINDIDDRDLEAAASMMAGLSFGGVEGGAQSSGVDGDSGEAGSVNSGDSEKSYNSGETAHTAGYLFDDPLGQPGGALGIELGKLTQYKAGENTQGARRGNNHQTDDSDDDRNSSSDEEDVRDDDEDDEPNDVPVMDLFAGNFNYQGNATAAVDHDNENSAKPTGNIAAFDFANFEGAFDVDNNSNAGVDDMVFGEFTGVSSFPVNTDAAATATDEDGNPVSSTSRGDMEDIFGCGSSSSLLDDLEEIVEGRETLVGHAVAVREPAERVDDNDDEEMPPPATKRPTTMDGEEMVVVPATAASLHPSPGAAGTVQQPENEDSTVHAGEPGDKREDAGKLPAEEAEEGDSAQADSSYINHTSAMTKSDNTEAAVPEGAELEASTSTPPTSSNPATTTDDESNRQKEGVLVS